MNLDDIVQNIASLVPEPICVSYRSSLDATPRIQWVNAAFCDLFGLSPADHIGQPTLDLFHWDYVDDFISACKDKYFMKGSSVHYDSLLITSEKSSFWGRISFTPVPDTVGTGRHGIYVIHDIDELKNREQSAELALIQNESLLRDVEAAQTRLIGAIDMIPDPFALYDHRERLIVWNTAFTQNVTADASLLTKGMQKEEIFRMTLENGFITEAAGREDAWLATHMAEWRGELPPSQMIKIRGRDYKSIISTVPNGDRVVLRIDISEQLRQRSELEKYASMLEQANNEISHQANHDELTGLGNRRYLKTRLDDLIDERTRHGGEIAVLHIDLDKFKQVNDSYGHAAGDHALVVVADILRKRLRQNDIIARTGGDEFVVLLKIDADSTLPEELADRLIADISEPFTFQDQLCRIGASIGIARTPVVNAGDLLTNSDIAMYKAKRNGRSTLAVFDHGDLEDVQTSKRMSRDILRGIENDEFRPVYQVLVNARDHHAIGFEVLAAWHHPTRGLLPESQFLGDADDMSLIAQIGRMVLGRALGECKKMFSGQTTVPSLAFNAPLQQIMDDDLDHDLDRLDYPGPIAFEMVETEFVDCETQEFLDRIEALRARGVTLEIDDFGSGRSSIVGLRQVQADRLKIDQRLIQPIASSNSAFQLVRSIVDIGRALEISVTATGVETAHQAALLTDLGCDRLQGSYFAPPLPLSDAFAEMTRINGKMPKASRGSS